MYCDDCKREMESIWKKKCMTDSREKALNIIGKECSRCGYSEFKCSLDVHHKDKGKREDWHRNEYKNWKNLIVLCRNCHQGLHKGEWKL